MPPPSGNALTPWYCLPPSHLPGCLSQSPVQNPQGSGLAFPGWKICSFLCNKTNNYYHCGGGSVTKLCPTLVTPWTEACQVPLSTGFPRQEYWSGLPFPSPGNLPNPEIEPRAPALQVDFLLIELQGRGINYYH